MIKYIDELGNERTMAEVTDTSSFAVREDLENVNNELTAAIRNISNLGKHVGTFDTFSVLPYNVSAFAPLVPTVNDFANIRSDENNGNGTTRYIIDSIAGDGAIAWTFDIVYATDVTGKMDRVPSANAGQLAVFDDDGQVAGADTVAAIENETAAREQAIDGLSRAMTEGDSNLRGRIDEMPGSLISEDADNGVTLGSDGKLFASMGGGGFVPMMGLSLPESVLNLEVGTTRMITPVIEPENATIRRLLWVSSNPDVAICTVTGEVTVLSEGTATITVYSLEGDLHASMTVNGVCVDNYIYTYNAVTGFMIITGYTGGSLDIIIPPTISGRPVVSLGQGAFHNRQLTSVVIPDSVTSIQTAAFLGNRLTSVTIPDSVTLIGHQAFDNNQLTSIVIGNSVTSIQIAAFENNQLTSVIDT